MNLTQLEQTCLSCQRCELGKSAQNKVVSRGNPATRLMVVGESPGAEEDQCGKPFMGKAGKLLDKMFAAISLDTNADMYITNTIKCRPPDNRNPTPLELDNCKPYLDQQIDLIKPTVIVAVGNFALNYFVGKMGITKLHGKWFDHDSGAKVMAIYHPAFLLRNEYKKLELDSPHRQTYKDLLAIFDGYRNNSFKDANL